jgi:hypothetical protein
MEQLTGKDALDAVEALDTVLEDRVDDVVRVLRPRISRRQQEAWEAYLEGLRLDEHRHDRVLAGEARGAGDAGQQQQAGRDLRRSGPPVTFFPRRRSGRAGQRVAVDRSLPWAGRSS